MVTVQTELALLESGDRLSRAEFHRRYCALPNTRAELVEGVVYVASPVRVLHGEPHGDMVGLLFTYRLKHPGVRVGDNITVRLDAQNEVQPDAFLWCEEPGGSYLDADGYVTGAPQFVVEIAVSSASYDLHDKKEAYRRNGVREYLVWRVLNQALDWFRLEHGEYVLVHPDERGIIESTSFPGLRLAVAKLLAGDLPGVLAELR